MKQLHLNYRNYDYFSNTSIRNTCKEVKDYKFVKACRALKKAGNSNTNSSTTNPPKHVHYPKENYRSTNTVRVTIE
jgi:hypothetical protein